MLFTYLILLLCNWKTVTNTQFSFKELVKLLWGKLSHGEIVHLSTIAWLSICYFDFVLVLFIQANVVFPQTPTKPRPLIWFAFPGMHTESAVAV